jgi:hypothetical protein
MIMKENNVYIFFYLALFDHVFLPALSHSSG